MRKILFRGFNKKNGTWIKGFYLQNRGNHFVCPDEFANGKSWNDYEVDPDSVGEFADIHSEDGEEVFEGDIIRINGHASQEDMYVVFYEGEFAIATKSQYNDLKKGVHPFFNDYKRLPPLCEFENNGLVEIIDNVYNHERRTSL